jgi:uncharacterized protein with HEPN domain
MPPTVEDRLRDILEAIIEIEQLAADQDLARFAADKTRRMAPERYLEIVCEAARNLTDDIKRTAPEIEWRKMVDFGNVLRHAYHATNVEIVWDIVQRQLPPLKSFAERSIRSSRN